MDNEPRFAADLYRGTAGYYDRYRLPYPEAMTEHLIASAGVSGHGRLLDLACGTGQLTFPLRRWFSEVWAVDREPDMAEAVRAKADALGAGNIRAVAADAEALGAEPGYFELAVIGNAFHRFRRDLVAGPFWLAQAGRLRGAVLVIRAGSGRGGVAAGARGPAQKVARHAWRRGQGARELGGATAAAARSPGAVRGRL